MDFEWTLVAHEVDQVGCIVLDIFADPCHALMPLMTSWVPSGRRTGYITDETGPGQSEMPCSCWVTMMQLYIACPHRGE